MEVAAERPEDYGVFDLPFRAREDEDKVSLEDIPFDEDPFDEDVPF